MTEETAATYDEVQDSLHRLGLQSHPAEVQGRLCGRTCAGGDLEFDAWLGKVAPEYDPNNALASEALEPLKRLHKATRLQLNDPGMRFEPLLPPDSVALASRVEALGDWCLGFLEGMAEGGVRDVDGLPGDAAEVARDLLELSQASSFELEGGDEDEDAYVELVEYLRTATLLVMEEMQPTSAPPLGSGATFH